MSSLEKILRLARAAQKRARSVATPLVAPSSDDERALVKIWQDALGIDPIGVDDGFFHLGGSSLELATIGGKIVSTFGVDIPLATLFAHVTVGRMASAVAAARGQLDGATAPLLRLVRAAERPGEIPAALPQVYYHALYAPNHNRFIEMYQLEGPLDVAALDRAFAEVVRRHEVLRTTLEEHEGRLVQVVHAAHAKVTEVGAADEEALARLAREEMERVIDLSRPPLVECMLARVDEHRHALLLAVPHVIVDDWSLDLVFRELVTLYNTYAQGAAPPLPEPELQYADYAIWQKRRFDESRHLAFWRDQLAGAAALELPTDRPRAARARSRQRAHTTNLSPALLASLRSVGSTTEASLFMTLLAGFAVFLRSAAEQDTFIIRSPFANREPPETERIVGSFSHPLPFRADLTGNPSFREAVRRIRDNVIEVHAHRPVPFGSIRADRALWDDFDRKCNRVGFNLLVTDRSKSFGEMAGIRMSSLARVWRTAVRLFLDFYLFAAERNGGLELVVYYNEEIFDAARIATYIESFRQTLEAVARAPDEPISKGGG